MMFRLCRNALPLLLVLVAVLAFFAVLQTISGLVTITTATKTTQSSQVALPSAAVTEPRTRLVDFRAENDTFTSYNASYCHKTVQTCQQTPFRPSKPNNTVVTTSLCKTLWVSALTAGYPSHDDIADGGDGYLQFYKIALASAQDFAPFFQPVLIVLTPPNATNSTIPKQHDIVSWALQQQVRVLHISHLSFESLIFSHFPEYALDGRLGYYIRLELPKLLDEMGIWNTEPNLCQRRIVLYTDTDVMFVNNISPHELESLKDDLVDDKMLSYGQDYLINRPKPSNTGIMLMDVDKWAQEWSDKVLRWGQVLPKGKFPVHDQLWLNRYYSDPRLWKTRNALLPPLWNWKVYWKLEPNQLEDLRIVHFHGPKPGVGLEEVAGGKEDLSLLPPDYHSLVLNACCCDREQTAKAVLEMYKSYREKTMLQGV